MFQILLEAIDILKKIVEFAKGLVEKTKKFVELAEMAAEKIEETAAAGKKVLEALATYGRKNIINIHHICFSMSLEKAKTPCFTFKVKVTLGGKKDYELNVEACIDGSFVKSIAKAIAENLFPGIDTIKEKLKQAREYIKDLKTKHDEVEKQQKDSEKEEKSLEGKLDDLEVDDDDDDVEKEDAKGSRKVTTLSLVFCF